MCQTTCMWWSIHWVCQRILVLFKLSCFLTAKREAKLGKRAHLLEPMFRNWAPEPPTGAHWDRKGAHSGFGMGFRGPELPGHPVELLFALTRPDFCEVHDLRDPRHCFVDEVYGPAHNQCELQSPSPKVRTVKHIQYSTTSQTVKQRLFSPREASTKRVKLKSRHGRQSPFTGPRPRARNSGGPPSPN